MIFVNSKESRYFLRETEYFNNFLDTDNILDTEYDFKSEEWKINPLAILKLDNIIKSLLQIEPDNKQIVFTEEIQSFDGTYREFKKTLNIIHNSNKDLIVYQNDSSRLNKRITTYVLKLNTEYYLKIDKEGDRDTLDCYINNKHMIDHLRKEIKESIIKHTNFTDFRFICLMDLPEETFIDIAIFLNMSENETKDLIKLYNTYQKYVVHTEDALGMFEGDFTTRQTMDRNLRRKYLQQLEDLKKYK